MNSRPWLPGWLATPALLGLLWLFAGCASTPQVDWTARLGEFTYQQAVAELGPPTRETQLGDGKLLAEWVSRSQPSMGYNYSLGAYGANLPGNSPGAFRERVLRLTFGEDGKLQNWFRNY